MNFSIYEEGLENARGERSCLGIRNENGRVFLCIPYKRRQIEELVKRLNRSDISECHVEEVVPDFEGYWIYEHMGNW